MVSRELIEKLEKYLDEMKDWERKPVVKSGRIVIEIVKLPEKRTKSDIKPQRLALMIRREDAFRGMIIESPEELEDLAAALSIEKVKEIAEAVWVIFKKRRVQEFEI